MPEPSLFADLHIHTYYSDGTYSPGQAVKRAQEAGVHCIAITDHDTIEGVLPTMEEAKHFNVEVIPGIELSSRTNNRDVHILGYCFDMKNKAFKEKLKILKDERVIRMGEMVKKLKTLGINNIELEEVLAESRLGSIGRPHLANVLIKKNVVATMKLAFDKYLDEKAPAFVSMNKLTTIEAIDLIRQAGGVAVMAHPMVTNMDEIIPQLVKAGLQGLEVYYSNCTQGITDFYKSIADKHGLIATGGSDAHGDHRKHTYVGKTKIPYELVTQLKALKK